MLNIYNYKEVHLFLRDSWKEKKKRNPSFSMTAWAKQLGLENSSPLSLAFKGKRTLPKKYLPDVIRSLGLSSDEGVYLEALVDLSKAKSPDQRLFYMKRIEALSPVKGFNNNTVEEYKFISDPIHSVILEMTDLKGFRCDPRWIKNKLRLKITVEEVAEIIDRLFNLGLLSRESSRRKVGKTHKNLTTEPDVADIAAKKYHKMVSEFAAQQVFDQGINDREFNSYTFNLKRNSLPEAKESVRKFLRQFFSEFEAQPGESNHTYQFNLQLFKMTE